MANIKKDYIDKLLEPFPMETILTILSLTSKVFELYFVLHSSNFDAIVRD